MGRPRTRAANPRPRLDCEPLEVRVTPAADFADGRVLVSWPAPVAPSVARGLLDDSPLSASVEAFNATGYVVTLNGGVDVESAAAAFAAIPGVRAAAPDYAMAAQALPNDPQVSSQWHLRDAASGRGGTNASAAWTVGTGTGQTIVAVIDSGTDLNHPDLRPNLWVNPREAANGRDDDGNGFVDDIYGADFTNNTGTPQDQLGHGTHVAGIIGAAGNNSLGVTGVAQKTRIMSLKFMGAGGTGYASDAIRAIDYALANGAKVINLSWGGGPYNPFLDQALRRAESAGALVIASAGNSGANTGVTPFYPASYAPTHANVLSVAATTQSDAVASWSNYGAAVKLAAPGEAILSTTLGGGYGTKSGTSMAAPVIAGAIAALWDSRPGLTAAQVVARFQTGVDAFASFVGKVITPGRLNFAKLMGWTPPVVSPPVAVPPVVRPPATSPPVTTAGGPRVTAGEFFSGQAGMFDRLRVTFSTPVNLATLTPADFIVTGPRGAEVVSAVLPVAGSNNTQFQIMFNRGLTAAGTYTAKVGPDVADAAGRKMDQNGNGAGGEAADAFTFTGSRAGAVAAPPVPAGAAQSYLVSPGTPLKDWNTTRLEFAVGDTFTVGSVELSLSLTHARMSDLSIVLQGPSGQRVQLFYRRGVSGMQALTFSDAGSPLGNSGALTGAVRAEQSLAALAGGSAKGTWVLLVHDLAAGAAGALGETRLRLRAK